jgi:integrase
MAKNDLAFATLDSYRKILDAIWRPEIGMQDFESVKYSTLVKIADARSISKKTYNNIISPLRCAFDYGYRDHPEKHNPATGLKGFRITKKDRPVVDPFTIEEAEGLITAIHRDWGEAQGNYDEFRFFTGLRPSEQIALRVTDCDLVQGKISVTKARVMARDKDRTKTSEDRLVELSPRALHVLKRHLALRAELKLQGRIDHEDLFFKEDGTPIRNLQYPWIRWKKTLQRMKVRYREPYNARHSSVSWNLMVGKNPLWVAKQHGHSVQTMLEVYAAWTEGAKEADIEAIRQAMQSQSPRTPTRMPARIDKPTARIPLRSPEFGTDLALERGGITVSDGNPKENTGGERGIRTLEGLLTLTPLAGVRLRPLGHLSDPGKNAYGPGAYGSGPAFPRRRADMILQPSRECPANPGRDLRWLRGRCRACPYGLGSSLRIASTTACG